ncbi:MAG: hypothetical protein ACKVX7_00635 [Planctomycetota bacterium]
MGTEYGIDQVRVTQYGHSLEVDISPVVANMHGSGGIDLPPIVISPDGFAVFDNLKARLDPRHAIDSETVRQSWITWRRDMSQVDHIQPIFIGSENDDHAKQLSEFAEIGHIEGERVVDSIIRFFDHNDIKCKRRLVSTLPQYNIIFLQNPGETKDRLRERVNRIIDAVKKATNGSEKDE